MITFAAIATMLEPKIVAFAEQLLKDPAMSMLGRDVVSRALRSANRAFVESFDCEYQRSKILPTLFKSSVQKSVAAFMSSGNVQEWLLTTIKSGQASQLETVRNLWSDIRDKDGKALIGLPSGFDWNNVLRSYQERLKEILAALPEFREREKLSRIRDIASAVDDIRGVRPPSLDIAKYRHVLLEEFHTLKLSALYAATDPSLRDHSVALQSVYIQQRVKEAFPPRHLSRDYRKKVESKGALSSSPNGTDLSELREEYERVPQLQLTEVLSDASCRRVVIMGDPGLGKSTLIQHLALKWADDVGSSLPLIIELRKYTRDHTHPRSFLEFLERGSWASCHFAQNAIDQYLRQNASIVMFDGLDEVFDPTLRGNIVSEIIAFSREYSKAQILVTTRVIGYAVGSPNPELFRHAGFRQFTLQDFDEQEINSFVRRWHSTAFRTTSEDREELERRLSRALEDSPAVRELAANPLLLTMMVLLNRRGRLPHERVKLYEACAGLLVEGWDTARHLEHADYLTQDDKLDILQRVAYEMQHESGGIAGNMISEDRLKPIFVEALENRFIPNPGTVTDRILGALSERDFMLCFAGDDQYAFVHRSFLEYFCAKEYEDHLRNAGDPDELLRVFRERWKDDAWHEVLRLLCGIVGPTLAGRLIGELLAVLSHDDNASATLLAAECLTEVRQLGKLESLRASVRQRLEALLRFDFPYRYFDWDEESTKVATIRKRALSLIARGWRDQATRDWLSFIVLGSKDWAERRSAINELARGWRDEATMELLSAVASQELDQRVRTAAIAELARGWRDETRRQLLVEILRSGSESVVRQTALTELASGWPDATTHQVLIGIASRENDETVRATAVTSLGVGWRDDTTRETVSSIARQHGPYKVRGAALGILGLRWRDETTLAMLCEIVLSDTSVEIRCDAIRQLAKGWRTTQTCELLQRFVEERSDSIKQVSMRELARGWRDSCRQLLVDAAQLAGDPELRQEAITELARAWRDERARELITSIALRDADSEVQRLAVNALARGWRDQTTHTLLSNVLIDNDAPAVRQTVLVELSRGWSDDSTSALLRDRARHDRNPEVRWLAVYLLTRRDAEDPTRQLLIELAANDNDSEVRDSALDRLVRKWRDSSLKELVLWIFAQDDSTGLRKTALIALARAWREDSTHRLLTEQATSGHVELQTTALTELAIGWQDDHTRLLLSSIATDGESTRARSGALEALATYWHDDDVKRLMSARAAEDPSSEVRQVAIRQLASGWRDSSVRDFLLERAAHDLNEDARETAIIATVTACPDELTREMLLSFAKSEDARQRKAAITALAPRWADDRALDLARDFAANDNDATVRFAAVEQLGLNWSTTLYRDFLIERAKQDSDPDVRWAAVLALTRGQGNDDDVTHKLLLESSVRDEDPDLRKLAIHSMGRLWRNRRTREELVRIVVEDSDAGVRLSCITELASRWRDESTKKILQDCATQDNDANVRDAAISELAEHWRLPSVRQWLRENIVHGNSSSMRKSSVKALSTWWHSEAATRELLFNIGARERDPIVQASALKELAIGWPEKEIRDLLLTCAETHENMRVRRAAILGLATSSRDDSLRDWLLELTKSKSPSVARAAVLGVARRWGRRFVVGQVVEKEDAASGTQN